MHCFNIRSLVLPFPPPLYLSVVLRKEFEPLATMSGKSKTPRDANAPKRNMSAYLLYQNAMRETFKAQNPGMTFGQLAKYTSAMYAEMPVSEKEAWQARAEADKARYLHELSQYVPPPGYDAKGDAILQPAKPQGGRRSGKKMRDPEAPKRAMSAYLLYQNAMREQFKRDNPGMTFGQLAKYTSHMYKSLTTEEKATWEARAAQDKARYDAEMAVYVPPPGHDAQGNLLEEYRYGGKRQKKQRDPNAPKRARGSYVLFTSDMRPQILKEYPTIKFTDMGNVMGERWRALTPDQKRKYEDLAAEDKVRFARETADYQAQRQAAEAAAAEANPPPPPAPVPAHHAMHHAYDHVPYDTNAVYAPAYTHDPSQYYQG